MGWDWWSNEPGRLACMVRPDLYEGRHDLIPADILRLRSAADMKLAVAALYGLLSEKRVNYDVNPPLARDEQQIPVQRVRQPREVFGGGRGTCLDLALIFCGMCENARLRPLLVLLKFGHRRHAMVVVGPAARDDPNDRVDIDLEARNGIRAAMPWSELELLLRQGWLAVDPASATMRPAADGVMPPADFATACDSAVVLLAKATEIVLLDIVYLHKNGPDVYHAESLSAVDEPEFSAEIRDRFGVPLATVGIGVPDRWGRAELARLHRESQEASQTTSDAKDLLEALCIALNAMPVFERIGGHDIGIRKLQDLYNRHVGRWPDASSREAMLIQAASVTIAERHNDDHERPTALARFMLGIAGCRKAPNAASPDDPILCGLKDWITETLRQQRDDANAYFANKVGGRTWALIELHADEQATVSTWPDRVVVDLVREHGPGETYNIRCAAKSEEGLRQALRRAISKLPDAKVCVDLFMPRHLLDAGVEHYEVVQVGVTYETMSRNLDPRLRWRMHRYDRRLRERLQQRAEKLDWTAPPEMIPQAAGVDPVKLESWLKSRGNAGMGYPPYFSGNSPDRAGHDLLGTLLQEGHGFVVWFGPDTPNNIKQKAVHLAAGRSALERRHELPEVLTDRLGQHRPSIIWSDPEGRGAFALPAARRGGTLRGGTR